MKKILVTGCNGQLGRAVALEYGDSVELIPTDVFASPPEGAAADRGESQGNQGSLNVSENGGGQSVSESSGSPGSRNVWGRQGIRKLDITDTAETLAMVRELRPDVILNCAAATNVDGCETDQDFAYRVNAIGPRNLAIAASETGAKLVHISTDYVFPGTSERPLTEFDTPAPLSAYGRTKYAGERFVQQFARRYFILRTAWLYGDGKNFVRTMLKLSESREEISVVCDQFGSPTSAAELAKVIHALEPTENYGIFHATCEDSTNWAAFAEEIFRLAGRNVRVRHVTSQQYKAQNPASADRPAYSILDNYMLRLCTDFRMARWQDALAEYMKGEQ